MTVRIFDLLLIFVSGAFIFQAIRTPVENYDVMGPSLWPLSVAIPMLGLLVLNSLLSRRSRDDVATPLSNRFWLMCLAMVALVGLQVLAIVPFFLSAAGFCLCAFLLMSDRPNAKSILKAGSAAVFFCFLIQYLFTSVIILDLKTTF